ncbi:spermatogenesis-associated protein 4 [Phoenicopterus ruber ruber]
MSKLNLAQELTEGTTHCKPGAAGVLAQDTYTMRTNRGIKKLQDSREVDFTNCCYQARLPMVARSTASKATKSNMRLTEIMMEPSININRQKVNAIVNMHVRMQEREEDPCEWFLLLVFIFLKSRRAGPELGTVIFYHSYGAKFENDA